MTATTHDTERLDPKVEEQLRDACLGSATVMNLMMDAEMELLDSAVFNETTPQTNLLALQEANRLSNRADARKLRYLWGCFDDPSFARQDEHGDLDVRAEAIGAALGATPFIVARLRESADVLYFGMPATMEAFHRGDISLSLVRTITQKLKDLTSEVWLAIDTALAPQLAHLTPTEATREVDRLLVELNPDGSDTSQDNNAQSRGVSRPRATSPGMGRIVLDLPIEQCVSIDVALDTAAKRALGAGDCRTYQQIRGDLLAEAFTRVLRDGFESETDCGKAFIVPPTKISVTIPLEVLMRAHADFDVAAQMEPLPDGTRPRLDAAWIEGYGPIAPSVAILMAAGGTWQRIVTDTLTGAPLDVGRERYRPPENIVSAVKRRDRFCRAPGCTRQTNLDIDHIVEWQHGGSTSLDNLQLLCRRCHRLKSVGLTRVAREEDSGARLWEIGGVKSWEIPREARRFGYLTEKDIRTDDGPPPF
ncbi:hypothetical protein BSZ39_02760 [Bowdeniella nasicola]|uniref:HNH nuclease domain-containing protein n=1 Tax=Bowdeniella nasicola TaxID=208480 RepID=A0A1Q5Q4K4_9ACTO|nr:HNH endonuclease signature motif containing protein [Bowdeniella nasicola]OKL54723.1 hypothetical protein BSZ39_02760 [Bowdeniella nasicola]